MALDTVPWFIGGGAEHSPAVARTLAYAATNGATGVIGAGDLRVTALPTPGGGVRILPGSGLLENLYPGGSSQSYVARNPTATDLTVTAAGSSGQQVRHLILRIDDPEYGGQAPTNVRTGPYVRAVLVSSLANLAYPFLPLATITQPANTSTVTQAMIKDIRQVANPRSLREVTSSAAGDSILTSTTGQAWPPYAPAITVPTWANWVHIIVHLAGFKQEASLAEAALSTTMGGLVMGGALTLDFDNVQDGVRHTTMLTGSGPVPENLRGTSVPFGVRGARLNVSSRPGRFISDQGTHMAVDVQFSERTV